MISDICMPNVNGIELRRRALSERPELPVILITGRRELRAQYASLIERDRYFEKPFDGQQLLQLVHTAFALDRERRRNKSDSERLQRHFELLTPREREVLPLVASGLLNKQAAAHLGISEVTLQTHRTNLMRKMEADSLAELVRMAASLGIPVTRTRH